MRVTGPSRPTISFPDGEFPTFIAVPPGSVIRTSRHDCATATNRATRERVHLVGARALDRRHELLPARPGDAEGRRRKSAEARALPPSGPRLRGVPALAPLARRNGDDDRRLDLFPPGAGARAG